MRDKELYSQILGIRFPWQVSEVELSVQAGSRRVSLNWNAIDGIMQRAVRRGLERREVGYPERIGVNETSLRKRHDYVTVVSDHDEGSVLYVADDRIGWQEPRQRSRRRSSNDCISLRPSRTQ